MTNEIEVCSDGLLFQQLIRSAVSVWFGKHQVTSTLEGREPRNNVTSDQPFNSSAKL
jgi:hypothetical protein